MDIVDRRLNPGGKSLSNRQRYMRRKTKDLREALGKSLKNRKIGDDGGQEIQVPDNDEPTFRKGNGGERDIILPGNGNSGENAHVVGDTIPRPYLNRRGGGVKAAKDLTNLPSSSTMMNLLNYFWKTWGCQTSLNNRSARKKLDP